MTRGVKSEFGLIVLNDPVPGLHFLAFRLPAVTHTTVVCPNKVMKGNTKHP